MTPLLVSGSSATALAAGAAPGGPPAAADPQPRATLLGTWVQDESGPVLTLQRILVFQPDGTYGLVLTTRPSGSSTTARAFAREVGRYAMQGDRIVLQPASAATRTYRVAVERDPVLGEPSLVLTDGHGGRNRYCR